jgi:hypothetical protein
MEVIDILDAYVSIISKKTANLASKSALLPPLRSQ